MGYNGTERLLRSWRGLFFLPIHAVDKSASGMRILLFAFRVIRLKVPWGQHQLTSISSLQTISNSIADRINVQKALFNTG